MERPLSQLIYATFHQGTNPRRIVTLHRYNEFLETMREIGLAANPDGVAIGLQASKGVYLGRTVVGYTWFVGPLDRPSPVHYGDAMQEIERFLWDEVDRQTGEEAILPFLVGAEQGAIMALAMAAAVPDLISGVVAINATFPIVPGWEPPLAPLDGLPILLVSSPSGAPESEADESDPNIVSMLTGWNATVTDARDVTDPLLPQRIVDWVSSQPIRTRRR